MGIFDVFKKKAEPLTAEEKLDRLWELWKIGDLQELDPACAVLLTYESEVNNGGHSQYFFNIANCGDPDDLIAEVAVVMSMLPDPLQENLYRAYEAFTEQEDISDNENEDLFDECDNVFYENEQLLIDILQEMADNLL